MTFYSPRIIEAKSNDAAYYTVYTSFQTLSKPRTTRVSVIFLRGNVPSGK